jgi:hypothetical protein
MVWKIKGPIKMANNSVKKSPKVRKAKKNTANLTGKSTIASPKD